MKRLFTAVALIGIALTSSVSDARISHHYARHSTYHSYGPAGGRHYTNVDGNSVHSPMRMSHRPAAATAQCRDGSWSFSQHHRGTCSHHGGVASW